MGYYLLNKCINVTLIENVLKYVWAYYYELSTYNNIFFYFIHIYEYLLINIYLA